MSRLELATVFNLNLYQDVKWCIYDSYWKHICPIRADLKAELLDKARLFALMSQYKQVYNDLFYRFDEREIHGTIFRSYNRTTYLDAMLYDLGIFGSVDDPNRVFTYICNLDADPVIEDGVVMVFKIQSNIYEQKEKLAYIVRLWDSLEPNVKTFVENNVSVMNVEDIMDVDDIDNVHIQ